MVSLGYYSKGLGLQVFTLQASFLHINKAMRPLSCLITLFLLSNVSHANFGLCRELFRQQQASVPQRLYSESNTPEALHMSPKFIGEHTRAAKDQVPYLNKDQREALRVEVHKQQIYSSSTGRPIPTELSGLFVISLDGGVYINWSHDATPKGLKHSSFFAGAPVLFAGVISINAKGQVLKISNHSGHYLTPKDRLPWAANHLEYLGYDVTKTDLVVVESAFMQNWNSLKSMWNIITGKEKL